MALKPDEVLAFLGGFLVAFFVGAGLGLRWYTGRSRSRAQEGDRAWASTGRSTTRA